jgi:hypothetical protein
MRITSTGNVGIGTSSPATSRDVNGNVTITDKIIHSGDTNTSIRFPAADAFAVETNGAERIRVTSTGNVGIGTSSPTQPLQVVRSGATPATVYIQNITGDANLLLHSANTGANTVFFGDTDLFNVGFIQYTHSTDTMLFRSAGDIRLQTDGANERVRITSAGSVGIGTSSPSFLLEVISDASFHGVAVGRGAGNISSNTAVGVSALSSNTTGTVCLAVGTRALRDNTTGAANTAVGADTLPVTTTGSENTAVGQASMSSNTTGINNTSIGRQALAILTTGSNNVALGRNAGVSITTGSGNTILGASMAGTSALTNTVIIGAGLVERMRITSTGNVGIGTSSPTTLLDVNANSIRVRTARTPASAIAAGNQGEIAWDADYIYICTATDTWKRVAIATW